MNTTSQLKLNIMKLVLNVNDTLTLREVEKMLRGKNRDAGSTPKEQNKIPDFRRGVTQIRTGTSLKELIEEQNYAPVGYAEFRKDADAIEWGEEAPLEDLLAEKAKQGLLKYKGAMQQQMIEDIDAQLKALRDEWK